jgi:hypothetical protein
MSAVKEPKFFLTDGSPSARGGPGDVRTYREHVWRRDDYEALFDPLRLASCTASPRRSTCTTRQHCGASAR